MTDAARFLPYLGAVVFALPVVWVAPDIRTSAVILYLFPVWAGLCGLSVILSRHLDLGEVDEPDVTRDGEQGNIDEDRQR